MDHKHYDVIANPFEGARENRSFFPYTHEGLQEAVKYAAGIKLSIEVAENFPDFKVEIQLVTRTTVALF